MMPEQKEHRAGENHIFVDVIFMVWFSQGNHKAFKYRSEDVVLSSIKQPEADGETQRTQKEGWDIKNTSVAGNTFSRIDYNNVLFVQTPLRFIF